MSARALVHPGKIGLSLLHAFGYGCPVVTNGDIGAHTPEIAAFRVGETGLLFNEKDPGALAAAIGAIVSSPESRERMSRCAIRVAREDFNVGVMVERFGQLVDAVLST
jgi:glycosyltransferase involved in cell wall biosynthesis